MFKRKNVNFRWPATLSFVTESENENERFSRGHLRVFYKGETADHRFFGEEFCNELIKSLPYTPIVSHYDEEKDDFVGHATEQEIYGIVDPRGEITFEEDENGDTWAVCETIYYTERPDKVGEIAKKIEGHSQSLELDPSTVKYTVNYDERKHFKNIEFTAGHFIGVSVLGNDQKPAFTGSAFFALNEQFKQKMEILKNYCEGKRDQQGEQKSMDLNEFLTLSWGDISSKFCEAVNNEYGAEYYTYPVDFYDDCGIFRFYSYFDGSIKLMKIYYTRDEDGNVTLGKIVETHVVYEDLDVTEETGEFTADGSDDSANFEEDESSDNGDFETEVEEPVTEESNEEVTATLTGVEYTTEPGVLKVEETVTYTVPEEATTGYINIGTISPVVNEVKDEDIAQVATNEKVSAVSEDENQQETSSTASFTESERAELETLKREKKVTLIESYNESLSEEDKAGLMEELDALTYEELELKLLKLYKAHQEAEDENDFVAAPVPFAVPEPQKPETAENKLNSYIRRMLKK